MAFHTDKMKLEVQVPTGGLPNLIRSPFSTGANPTPSTVGTWVTPKEDTRMLSGFISGTVLQYFNNQASGSTSYFTSEYLPATAGKYYTTRLDFVSGTGFRMRFEWYNANEGLISSSTQTSLTTSAGTYYLGPIVAPATTAFVKLRVDHYTAGGANPTSTGSLNFRNIMVTEGATSGSVTTPAYAEPFAWLDILGPTHEISITRGSADVGTASVTVLDSALDPSTASTIKAGKQVRLRAYDGSGYDTLYTGHIKEWQVDYSDSKGRDLSETGATRITFTTADAIDLLNGQKERRAVATVGELAELLEGKGVAWNLNGSSDGVYTADVIGFEPDYSVLDQARQVKDSLGGYMWVSRDNVLNVYDRASLPTSVAATFTDTGSLSYTAITPATDTADIINSVTINFRRYLVLPGGNYLFSNVEEIVYGPYVNQTSINTYGVFEKTYTISLADESPTNVRNYANAILAANASPQLKVGGLRMKVRNQTEMTKAITLDVGSRVNVEFKSLYDQDVLIDTITHTITPEEWTVDYTFIPTGTYQPPAGRSARSTRTVSADSSPVGVTDTNGWVSLTHSGTSGSLRYMCKNGVVYVEGNITISMTSGASVTLLSAANGIPVDHRPSQSLWAAAGRINVASSPTWPVARFTDGSITAIQGSGSTAASIQFAYSYPLG